MLKVKLTKELDAFQYHENNKEELKKFLEAHKFEVLDIRKDEEYTLIFYVDSWMDAHDMEILDGWYLIFDQDGVELSACAPDYFNEFYAEVK